MKKSSFVIAKNPRKSFIHFFLSTLIGIEGKVAWLEIVFKIISEIQVVAILLYFPFQVIENSITDPLAFFIQKLSQYLCFYDLFDFTTPSWANNVLFTLSDVYVVCLVAPVVIIIGYHVLRKKIGQGLLKIWNSFGIIHYSFIFLLGYQYFLSLMNQLGDDSFTMFGDELNTSFILNAIIRLIPLVILAPLFCRFLYMPLKSDYMASRRTTTPEMLILIFKIIDVPLTVFYDNFRVQRWIRLIIMSVIFTWNACVHINDIPYFHYWPMKVSASFSFVYVALTVSNIILVILGITRNVQSLSSVYLAIIFSMFAIKAADLALKNIIKNSSQEVIEIKSTNDFYRKMFALNFILRKGSNRVKKDQKNKEDQYDFMLYGVISQHKKRCTKQVCGCQTVSQSIHGKSEYTIEMESQLERNFRFELRKELYRESLKKMPLNFELRIGFAYFLFQTKTHSDGSSISLMHALDSIHKNIEMQVISSMLLESIEKKIEKDNDHSVNIKDVVDYQFLSSELKTKIEGNSANLLHFWELYKSSDLSILQLFWESVKIEKEAKKIDTIWGQITRKYSKLAHQDHLFYGLYQSLVRNAPNTGHKTLLKYFSVTNNYDPDRSSDALVTSQNLHEPNNIFVYISMKKDKMGRVHYITYNVENILQYNQQDVIDKNVSMLMPPYFQERHNKYLVAHIEKGRTSALNKNTALFSRKKDGYMIPASVYVNIFPYFQEQLLYVGIIRPTKTFDDFLLVLDDGTIDSFTAAVGKKLGLNPQNDRRYHLRDISRDLAKLHRAFLQLVKEDSRKLSSVAPSSRNFSRTQTNLNPNVGTVLDLSRKGESTVIKEDEQTNKYKKQTSNPNSTSRSDGLGKLYEQFTTTGLPAVFKVVGEEEPEEDDVDQIRYNTIIGERIIYGSHVRVYQLQPLVTDDSMERPYTVNTMKSVVYSNTSPSKRTNREMSNIASSIPSDDGVNLDKEDEINFRNPFSGDDIGVVSGNREALTSPKELASPKDPLIPLLSATSQEKSTFDHPITITRNKQDSSYAEIASGAASRVYNKAKTSMPLRLKTLAERQSSQQDKVAPKTENNILNESHSIEKSEKHPQVENKDFGHFLKENQLLAAVKGNDPADRGSVASSVKTTKINSKLESAIYFNDKSLATKMLTVVVLLFCVLSVVLLVLDQIVTKANLEKVKNNVEVLELSYERLFYVLEANRRVKRIDFIQRGLAPSNRHVANYVSFNQQALAGVASNLTYDNSQMRNVIYKIQATELPQFYNLIPVIGKDGKIRQDNTFDLCTEISSTALEIYDMLPTKPAAGDSNVEFILNNTLNDLLVESQNIVSILRADNSASMGNIQHTMTGTLITVVVIFAVIFASFVKTEIDFIKAKAHFIEVFLMVKDHEMEVPLYMLNNFYTSLKETKKETGVLEKLTDDKLAEKARLVKAKKSENKAFKGKKANTKGVNTPTFVNIVFTFIFMSVYWALFTAILNVFTTTEVTINTYRRRTINGKVNNFNYGLALAGLYEYITENGTTNLLDAPISTQWENIYSDLTGNLTTLASYVNDNGEFQDQIEQLLAGNLCQLSVFADQTTCTTAVSGVAMKGLLAVNALIITFMRSVKDFFDSSDRSLLATMQALVMQNLLDTEVLFEIYSKRGYKALDSYMLQQFLTEVDGFQSYITSVIIGSAVILVVLTVICWFYVKKRVEKERLRYRRMLRAIPVSVFLGNRILKNYLLRNSSKILDSVKNRI